MKYIFLPLLILITSACSQGSLTKGDSYADPGWNGVAAQSMIVQVNTDSLAERKAIEDAVTTALQDRNLRSVQSYTLFPPTRDYSERERESIIGETSYETTLVITPYDHEVISQYSPPASYPFGSVGYGSGGYGGVGIGIGFDRGYYSEEPLVRYKADLYLITDKRKLWTSDYSSQGHTGMDYQSLGKSFSTDLVNSLEEDGLI